MLQNKAKTIEAHLGYANQVVDVSASTCLHLWSGTSGLCGLGGHLWFTATSGEDCFLEQPGGTRVVKNMPGSDTWWVKISGVSPVHAALALGMEHSNANTRWAASVGWQRILEEDYDGKGKDRQHREGHVLKDLQGGDNKFHKTRNYSFCCWQY